MELRVSNREANFDEFKKSQDEFKISQAKFRAEIKTTNDLIFLQLKLLAEKWGVESSAVTPTHQPFIQSTSPLSLEKSNEIVLKLQSFHKEKVRAREKSDEFWSQFHPRYKPKTRPCLRPTLKKFKKVRDYGKPHDDDSVTFSSIFRKALARENENIFDLFNKEAKASMEIPPFHDSNCKKDTANVLVSGLPISELLEKEDELPFSRLILENMVGFQLIFSVGMISGLQSLKNLDQEALKNLSFMGLDRCFTHEFIGSHALQVFDERSHSTEFDFQLGYHMLISDTGSTFHGLLTSNGQTKDAHRSQILICIGQFMKICTIVHLKLGFHEFTNDKGGTTIQMLFHSKSATVLESDYENGKSQVFILEIHVSNVEFKKAKLPDSRALYLFDKMSNSGYILDIKLGYHMSICDKGGTNFLFSFESIDLLASCKDLGFCVVINRSMGYYCKGICDKGGTISLRLFNSKSKNTDCVLGFNCSKVIKCEVSFDSSMIIDGDDAGDLGLQHLEACMDKNKKKDRKFTISAFETGWCVVLNREYCKGIQDKGGGSKFRKQTSEMICMHCLNIQPVRPICSTPSYNGLSMAKYHCPFCNLCLVGKGLSIDYFHYMKCNCCLSISIVNYRCLEKCLKVNCPICNDFLFTSTSSIRVLPCGHLMHVVCLEAFPRRHYSTCPICCKYSENMMRASTQSSILVSGLGTNFYVSIEGQIYDHWSFLRASYDMNIIMVVMAEMEKFMKVIAWEFMVDSLVLPLGECDVTIGAQWLYTFEPIFRGFQEQSHGFAGWRDKVEHLFADMYFKKLISQRSFGFIPSSTCKRWVKRINIAVIMLIEWQYYFQIRFC